MKRVILEVLSIAKSRVEAAQLALWTGEVASRENAEAFLEAANARYCRAKWILEKRYGHYPQS
jgi:hypothetical protein